MDLFIETSRLLPALGTNHIPTKRTHGHNLKLCGESL
ncbi:MAG: hypothetical protein ACI932_002303, partial [Paracoccaceae bacterium]